MNSFILCPVSADSITLTGFICQATRVVVDFIPVLVALALLYFLWGVAQWILNVNNEEKMREGRTRTVWGLVALFFILSIGGVITLLVSTFFPGERQGSAPRVTEEGAASREEVHAEIEEIINESRRVRESWGEWGI